MARVDILKAELTNDPLTVGYAGMTHAEAAGSLNAVPATAETGRQQDRREIPTSELFNAVDRAEYAALAPDDKSLLRGLLAMGTVNIQRGNTRATLAGMFGTSPKTRVALVALQREPASRGVFLDLGKVHPWGVARAKAI